MNSSTGSKTSMVEDQRHLQLMQFMAEFRKSMEANLQTTNSKLDTKLGEIGIEIKDIKEKIDKNDDKATNVMDRMNVRLEKLEIEMKKSDRLKDNREEIRRIEKEARTEKAAEEMKEKENAVNAVKKFARRTINPEDLRNENEGVTTFKSTWAIRMEEELSRAAGETGRRKEKLDSQDKAAGWMEGEEEDRQDAWERLTRKKGTEEQSKKTNHDYNMVWRRGEQG